MEDIEAIRQQVDILLQKAKQPDLTPQQRSDLTGEINLLWAKLSVHMTPERRVTV